MAPSSAEKLLRAGLLEGRRVLVAGVAEPSSGPGNATTFAAAAEGACVSLGARVGRFPAPEPGESPREDTEMDAVADRLLGEMGGIDLLFIDACSLFRSAPSGAAREALVGSLDATWAVTRAVASRAFIAREEPGRIVFAAPPATASPVEGDGGDLHVNAACAGLENLARTLSIEWARYGITTVAIAPGAATSPEQVGALTAYLASPAGAYFSGCLLDLRGPGP